MFDNNDDDSNPTLSEKPKVQLHYTVTPIGGAKELATWKASRKDEEDRWQARQDLIRAKQRIEAINIVAKHNRVMESVEEHIKLFNRAEKAEVKVASGCKFINSSQPIEGFYSHVPYTPLKIVDFESKNPFEFIQEIKKVIKILFSK